MVFDRALHPPNNHQLDLIKHHSRTATLMGGRDPTRCCHARISFRDPVRYRIVLVVLHAQRMAGGEARYTQAGENADRLALASNALRLSIAGAVLARCRTTYNHHRCSRDAVVRLCVSSPVVSEAASSRRVVSRGTRLAAAFPNSAQHPSALCTVGWRFLEHHARRPNTVGRCDICAKR